MLNITTGLLDDMCKVSTPEHAMKCEDKMNMLGINCRTSPIAVDEFTNAEPVSAYRILDERVLVTGDRAPDALGLVMVANGTETRLFDVFSPTYHTVVVFTPDVLSAKDVLEVLRRYPEDVIRQVIILPAGGGSEGTTIGQVDVVDHHGGHTYLAYLVVKRGQKVVVDSWSDPIVSQVRLCMTLTRRGGDNFAKILV